MFGFTAAGLPDALLGFVVEFPQEEKRQTLLLPLRTYD
jgi:hypothetical protein